MYQCRNCGGNLRFDIELQRLKCPYCLSDFDCYEVEEEAAAVRPEEKAAGSTYEVNIFSCPMCGGEIVSSDQSVSEFCSYCGQAVVLEKKLSRQKKPKKIIPFQLTEDACRESYRKKLKRAFFAPGALKDPQFLDKFRGIYIPYWSYSFYHQGRVKLTGTKEYRSGDYEVKEYYDVTGDVDASYEGIVFDASSSFSDELGNAISPYDPKGFKEFVPAYLSGFYADVADVPASIYVNDANQIANERTLRTIEDDSVGGKYDLSTTESLKTMNQKLHTRAGETEAAMLPVWFLTWRKKDRVAYMAVNGQTGKVAADIPVDLRKYIPGSLLLSVPLYFLFDATLFFLPPTILFFSGLFALATSFIYLEEMRAISSRDRREMDRGYQYYKKKINKRKKNQTGEEVTSGQDPILEMTEEVTSGQDPARELKEDDGTSGQDPARELIREGGNPDQSQPEEEYTSLEGEAGKEEGIGSAGQKKEKKPLVRRLLNLFTWLSLGYLFIYIVYIGIKEDIFSALFNANTLNAVLLSSVFIFWQVLLMDGKDNETDRKVARDIIGSQAAVILAALINIIHPVSDAIYYGGMILCYLGLFSTLIRVIIKYNLLITRPVPEFHHRGRGR